ncbi:MAG: hypothetical protein K2G34_05455, partial [Bacteroides sp.]|nr:hypothetical protein [Bacteroides sp.]
MKRITIILFAILTVHISALAQADTAVYGVVKNMPLFYGQLKQQLTYPMAVSYTHRRAPKTGRKRL